MLKVRRSTFLREDIVRNCLTPNPHTIELRILKNIVNKKKSIIQELSEVDNEMKILLRHGRTFEKLGLINLISEEKEEMNEKKKKILQELKLIQELEVDIICKLPSITDSQLENFWCSIKHFEKFGSSREFSLLGADLNTLKGTNAVNDQVVNIYLLILQKFSESIWGVKIFVTSSFFLHRAKRQGLESCALELKKNFRPDTDLIMLPLFFSNHWSIIIVEIKKKKLHFLDSTPRKDCPYFPIVRNLLFHLNIIDEVNDVNWTNNIPKVGYQTNDYDCGVYLCAFARNFIAGQSLEVQIKDISHTRGRLAMELYNSAPLFHYL